MAIFKEWRDSNKEGDYPFRPGAPFAAQGIPFPRGIIADLAISGVGEPLYLDRIRWGATLEGVFSDGKDDVASFAAPDSDVARGWSNAVSPDGRRVGIVVFGATAASARPAVPSDWLEFGTGMKVIGSLVSGGAPGLAGLSVQDDSGLGPRMRGEIDLECRSDGAWTGIFYEVKGVGDETVVAVHAVGQKAVIEDCQGDRALRTINSVGPDGRGGVKIITPNTDETKDYAPMRVEAKPGLVRFYMDV